VSPLPLPDPPLTDGVATVRPWSDADIDAVVAAGLDPVIPEMTTVVRDGTPADAREYIARQRKRAADGETIALAIADNASRRAVGWIGANNPDPINLRADIGYWVLDSARGRGLAVRAGELFVPWLVRALGLARVEAVIAPENHGSQRVVERLGFSLEGLLSAYMVFPEGVWHGAGHTGPPVSHDMLIYARTDPGQGARNGAGSAHP
jgi:RimJ/RimL family protein N-acetyltransferase